jgi:hypothetical protein
LLVTSTNAAVFPAAAASVFAETSHVRQHTSAYVSIRQHTSAYVNEHAASVFAEASHTHTHTHIQLSKAAVTQ